MDTARVPHKVAMMIATYEGDWTAEDIDSGRAGEPTDVTTQEAWFEPSENGPIEVTDPQRIEELEATIRDRTA